VGHGQRRFVPESGTVESEVEVDQVGIRGIEGSGSVSVGQDGLDSGQGTHRDRRMMHKSRADPREYGERHGQGPRGYPACALVTNGFTASRSATSSSTSRWSASPPTKRSTASARPSAS
jgi:hypothetical protein